MNAAGSGPFGKSSKFVVHLPGGAIRELAQLRKTFQVGRDHTLRFSLAERTPVHAELFRIDGKASSKLVDQVMMPGVYRIPLGPSSGIRVLRFRAGPSPAGSFKEDLILLMGE